MGLHVPRPYYGYHGPKSRIVFRVRVPRMPAGDLHTKVTVLRRYIRTVVDDEHPIDRHAEFRGKEMQHLVTLHGDTSCVEKTPLRFLRQIPREEVFSREVWDVW